MCWNAEVSLASLIVGISISLYIGFIAYRQKNYMLMALSLGWIWPILMQWIDYGLWKNYCNKKKKTFSWLGYILNILQPIVLYLIFILFPNTLKNKGLATIIIFIYTFYILYTSKNVVKAVDCVKTEPGKNINYPWWGEMKYGGILYLITLSSLFLLLIRPLKFSLLTLSYVLLTFVISMAFFNYGTASVWCWFAVLTPLVAYFINKIK